MYNVAWLHEMYWCLGVGVLHSPAVQVDEIKFCASWIRATLPDGSQSGRRIASGCTVDRYVITQRANLGSKSNH